MQNFPRIKITYPKTDVAKRPLKTLNQKLNLLIMLTNLKRDISNLFCISKIVQESSYYIARFHLSILLVITSNITYCICNLVITYFADLYKQNGRQQFI